MEKVAFGEILLGGLIFSSFCIITLTTHNNHLYVTDAIQWQQLIVPTNNTLTGGRFPRTYAVSHCAVKKDALRSLLLCFNVFILYKYQSIYHIYPYCKTVITISATMCMAILNHQSFRKAVQYIQTRQAMCL